jgi:hypothetical protein
MRVTYIDTMKGLLILGMVLAHTYQIYGARVPLYTLFSEVVNLVSFSGFFFCFGYACQLAYLGKERLPAGRVIWTALKILAGFYLSAFCYEQFMDQGLTRASALAIILLIKLPGLSEFLLAFVLVILVSAVFARPFKYVLQWKWLVVLTLACLATTLLSAHVPPRPWLCLFLGCRRVMTYPVVPYYPLFCLGAAAAAGRLTFSPVLTVLALAALTGFVFETVSTGWPPERFPPSALWIAGSFGLVYVYFLASVALDRAGALARLLRQIGGHALLWIVASNVLLFLPNHDIGRHYLPPLAVLIFASAAILAVYVVQTISAFLRRALQPRRGAR